MRSLGPLVGRGPLARHARRALGRTPWPLVGLGVLLAVVVANHAGRARARAMLVETRRASLERLVLPDLEIRTKPTDAARLRRAAMVGGVVAASTRLVVPGRVEPAGERAMPALVHVLGPEPTRGPGRLELVAGRWPRPDEPALVVDRSLQALHGVGPGTTLAVGAGPLRRSLPVVGVVASAELLLTPTHPAYVLPLRGTLAVVYVSAATLAGRPEARQATSLQLVLEEATAGRAVLDALAADPEVEVVDVVARHRQPALVLGDVLLENFDVYTPPTATVLGLVAALVLILACSRLVRRRRGDVGTLMSQGYARGEVVVSFLGVPLVAWAIGMVGGALAHGLYARVLADGLTRLAGYPPLVDPGPSPALLPVGLVTLAAAVTATLLPALHMTARAPAVALRPGARDLGHETASWLLRAMRRAAEALRVPFVGLLALLQVLRRRRETLGAVLGLGASFAVILSFLMVHRGHRREVADVVGRWSRDATVHFVEPVGPEVLEAIARRTGGHVEPFVSRSAIVEHGGVRETRRLLGVTPDGLAAGLPLRAGRPLGGGNENGCLVDAWLARHAGLEVGDELVLRPRLGSEAEVPVRVVGVIAGVSFGRIVVPLALAQSLHGLDGRVTGAHVGSAKPAAALEADLWSVGQVETVFGTGRIRAELEAAWAARAWVIRFAIGGAILVALVFLALLAGLDAADREVELATLHALGWRDGSVLRLLATEVFLRGLLAVGVAALLGPALAAWVADRLEAAHGYRVPPAAAGDLLVAVLGGALLVLPAAAIPAWRRARRLAPTRLLRMLRHD